MGEGQIRVLVKFFSGLADLTGCREVTVVLPAGAVLAELVDYLSERFGEHLAQRLASDDSDPFVYHVVALLDSQFHADPARSQAPLTDCMVVVFMEPVAGGRQQ